MSGNASYAGGQIIADLVCKWLQNYGGSSYVGARQVA